MWPVVGGGGEWGGAVVVMANTANFVNSGLLTRLRLERCGNLITISSFKNRSG